MSHTPADVEAAQRELANLRHEIEETDRAIIRLVAGRIHLARRVGAAKRIAGLPALDPAQEAAVVRRASEMAREEGAPEEDVRYLFWHLIGTSRRVQLTED
ncbi:MAG: chorismate mutase [Gemmatimonadaceae bacterium]